ncbi:E3 ubiquitin-protein ligase LRSAM1-like [Daphnia pulex]|uniref:E3 ubiquitin-protein ligase LRSAM1-like n=1 Tax=Daphnia pulex TaxID=6669 RepID=UPI001EDE07C6|nr:E3 ubiquitin-protein ligase LRSAM1-like [Daphnia pulex]
MGNSSSKSSAKKISTQSGQLVNFIEHSQMETEQSLAALAQQKERRRTELLAFEEQQAKRLAEEAQLKNFSQANHNKFLKHITESQKEVESRLAEIHQQQEASRQKFSEQLYKTEAEMEASIVYVLKNIQAHRDQIQLQDLVKAEENQCHCLLALKLEEFKNLRKEDILNAMKTQLEQDISSQKTMLNKTLFNVVQMEDEVKNRQIDQILQHRQKDQAALVMSLLEEESWQYQAFSSLLSQRDRRTTQLSEDIRAVVDKLNQLTAWELQRKSRQIDITNNLLSENRIQLADLLSQLIEQQQLRRKDLKHLLEEMEVQRQNQAADYWLVQYQRLIDNMPDNIQHAQQYLPSAPSSVLDDEEVASAPPMEVFMETNCVICLDSSCQVIFLSCGHLCCCSGCGNKLNQCPMCRATIVKRLQVHS